MKRSETQKEFELIQTSEHVDLVLNTLKEKIKTYFDKITSSLTPDSSNNEIYSKLAWSGIIEEQIEVYEKESKSYKSFFSEENMEEFEEVDDPKVFKSELKKECPIIHKSLMSKLEEMQEWKEQFIYASPNEIFEVFANFLDFARNYMDDFSDNQYRNLKTKDDFEPLADISEDQDFTVLGVIGSGIKTTVLYYISAEFFHKSVRRSLYGLYFLTEEIHTNLPSRTSEFIIIDDTNSYSSKRGSTHNMKIDHNYWYPFNLFMFYSNFIFKNLEELFGKLKIELQPKYRYLYVNMFLEMICEEKKDAIKTMMGGDQDY